MAKVGRKKKPKAEHETLIGKQLPSIQQIDQALVRRSFQRYIEIISPRYVLSKFHSALADILTRFTHGEFPNLIIQSPPQHGKSEQASRLLPGYLLGIHKGIDIIALAYGKDLAEDFGENSRRFVDSPEYRYLFPDVVSSDGPESIDKKSSKKMYYSTNYGSYRSTPIGGGVTGHGASFVLIDDPIKNREDADSPAKRNRVWDMYVSSVASRHRPFVTFEGKKIVGCKLLTLTRWHEDDLAGRLLQQAEADPNADQWTVLNFPAIYGEAA